MTTPTESKGDSNEQSLNDFAILFAALSDPVRLEIIARLAQEGELTVGDLSEPFAITAPAISRHLKVLETVGLIERRVDRQWRICSLHRAPLMKACSFMDKIARDTP
jgi:DNA-binding transcriptional ArsR family regulator